MFKYIIINILYFVVGVLVFDIFQILNIFIFVVKFFGDLFQGFFSGFRDNKKYENYRYSINDVKYDKCL